MSGIKAIYFVDDLGRVKRIRAKGYNWEEATLQALKVVSPNAQQVRLEYTTPGYTCLKDAVVLVGDFCHTRTLEVLHWFTSRLEASVKGSVWLVRGKETYAPDRYVGAYSEHADALRAAKGFKAACPPGQQRATYIALVPLNV